MLFFQQCTVELRLTTTSFLRLTRLLRPYSFDTNAKITESFYYFEDAILMPALRYYDPDFMPQRWSHGVPL